jgi:hypothetical protein
MAEFQVERALEILTRTPTTLSALLRGVSDEWAMRNEGGDSWSPYDVVGHLTHLEEGDWIGRIRTVLEHGESKPFASVDRLAMFEKYRGVALTDLLDRFAAQRRTNLDILKQLNITPDKLALRGTHPTLGAVTLDQLLATWAVHDLNHLGQIAKVMAKQYTDAVGPWKEFLLILGDT